MFVSFVCFVQNVRQLAGESPCAYWCYSAARGADLPRFRLAELLAKLLLVGWMVVTVLVNLPKPVLVLTSTVFVFSLLAEPIQMVTLLLSPL